MGEKKNGVSQEDRMAELIGSEGEDIRGWLLQAGWREIGRRPFHWFPSPSIFWNVGDRFAVR
jgi:hypothetical protein